MPGRRSRRGATPRGARALRRERGARSGLLLAAALLFACGGREAAARADAGSGSARAPQPEPAEAAFARLVAETESARGLRFARPPALAQLDEGSATARALAAAAASAPLEIVAPGEEPRALARAAPDLAHDRVMALRDADPLEIRLCLAHLLEAQHRPALAQLARELRGDAGRALRALLAARALATATGGLAAAPGDTAPDLFAAATLDVSDAHPEVLRVGIPTLAALDFLRAQRDPDAPLAHPPLSTEALLRPRRFAAGDEPLALVGDPPALPGCSVARDESLGLFLLLRAFAARGGRIPALALAGWSGDRAIELRCDAGSSAWLYVIELDTEPAAAAFLAAAEALLPADLEGPFVSERRGRRVTLSRAIPARERAAFERSLTARPLRELLQLP